MFFNKTISLLILLLVTSSALAGATDWQDVEISNGKVLIDVSISGVPAKALLDTGATSIAIDTGFLDEKEIAYGRGRKIRLQGIYGEKEVYTVKSLSVNLFGNDFPLRGAYPVELDTDFQVIIGLPFFKNYIVQIDYPNSRLKLIDRKTLSLKKTANVDLSHGANKRSLVVTGTLMDGEKIKLTLDTGSSSGLVFERKFAEQRGWLEKYRKAQSTSSGILESINNDILVIPEFKFGPYDLENLIVSVPSEDMPSNIRQEKTRPKTGSLVSRGAASDGILGYDVLKHFVVTLDAKAAKMHIFAP